METRETNNVMLIYAYDTQNNGTELGPGSKERINAGLKYIMESGWNDWVIILGAGTDPKRSQQLKPLKYLMRWYIVEMLTEKYSYERCKGDDKWTDYICRINIIQSETDAWGSFNETTSALDTFFKSYEGRVGYYYAVSADFHLPRIKLIWFMLGLSVKTIGTPWKPIWKERVLEPIKILKVLFLGSLRWARIGS